MKVYSSHSKLLESKGSAYISYSDKLKTLEWQKVRKRVLERDVNKCTVCFKRPNEIAWWLKNSAPFEVYFRDPDQEELKYMEDKIIRETERSIMHVHHKYYIKSYLPWDYNLEALVTVCSECHTQIHLNSDIFLYENEFLQKSELLITCERCSGTGYLPEFHYYHDGICFGCNGERFLNINSANKA